MLIYKVITYYPKYTINAIDMGKMFSSSLSSVLDISKRNISKFNIYIIKAIYIINNSSSLS